MTDKTAPELLDQLLADCALNNEQYIRADVSFLRAIIDHVEKTEKDRVLLADLVRDLQQFSDLDKDEIERFKAEVERQRGWLMIIRDFSHPNHSAAYNELRAIANDACNGRALPDKEDG